MAMLDTDFASDPQTCVEDEDFSDGDMKERRRRAGVGEKAHMAIGQAWRSPDVSLETDIFLLRRCLPL